MASKMQDPYKNLQKGVSQYDELHTLDPANDPMNADQELSQGEQATYDEMYSDFMDKMLVGGEKPIVKMIKSAPDLYAGVSQAAFTILKAIYPAYAKEGEDASVALFSEGGMIATAVDEVYQLAQAHRLEGSDDINQYSAAQIDMMRRVGEFMEQRQEDDGVSNAQDLLMDIEEANNPGAIGQTEPSDIADIDAVQYQDETGEAIAQEGMAVEDEEAIAAEGGLVGPPQPAAEELPPSGGLI